MKMCAKLFLSMLMLVLVKAHAGERCSKALHNVQLLYCAVCTVIVNSYTMANGQYMTAYMNGDFETGMPSWSVAQTAHCGVL